MGSWLLTMGSEWKECWEGSHNVYHPCVPLTCDVVMSFYPPLAPRSWWPPAMCLVLRLAFCTPPNSHFKTVSSSNKLGPDLIYKGCGGQSWGSPALVEGTEFAKTWRFERDQRTCKLVTRKQVSCGEMANNEANMFPYF